MYFGLCIIARAGLSTSEIDIYLISFSYLRRVNVIRAFHAEDSTNG